jgi:putative DNA methylase
MVWDWVEVNPFADAAGDLAITLGGMCQVLQSFSLENVCGFVEQRDAASSVGTKNVCFATDPPYYDNIAYADLSDFFYVWLRRSLRVIYGDLLSTVLVPKSDELVAKAYRFNGDTSQSRRFFEVGLGHAFEHIRERQISDAPFTVFYAFKQSEVEEDDDADDVIDSAINSSRTSTGWETMLEGLIRSRFSITGTWPMRSERGARSVAIGTNALASSIVLVCRPRPDNASKATRKDYITALRRELPEALRNLQRGNIAPVDLAQAAIGPGMAVFTRYAKVIESDGAPMTVRTALGIINQSLDEVLAEQEGEFDSDTRWALAWFEQFGMAEGPFGDAETLSKAKNTAVNGLVEAGIIVAQAGKVRLVNRDELPLDWNPATDKRLTAWEVTQHLIHRLDQQGELGASTLVRELGSVAEISRDLAYRLYSTCERKKWAQEALAYNSLVVAWPELSKLALSSRNRQTSTQQNLFE